MSKAPNGHGSIRKLETGKYAGWYRVAVVVGWRGKNRPRRKTGTFKKHADADAFRKRTLEEKGTGRYGSLEHVTVATHLEEWLRTTVKPNRADATHSSYTLATNRHIIPHIGHVRLLALEPRHLEIWLNTLLEQGVGDRTRQNAYIVLSAALNHAMRRGDLPANPCARVEKPRAKREKINPFTREEIDWILADSFEGRYAALFRLAISTGMRQGEIYGLRSRDVDLREGTVRVVRQAVETEGRVTFQSYPKTDAGNRTLSLTDAAIVLMLEYRKRMLKVGKAGRDLEFVAPEGGVIRRSTFGHRVWRPMLERLDIAHRGFHHVRHSYATLMLGSGVPLHVVSARMGHSKPSVTADLYAHAIPDQVEEARAAERRLFG